MAVFLSVSGVTGKSTDPGHPDWIDIISYSFTVPQSGSGVKGTGTGTGKAHFNDMQITVFNGEHSGELLNAASSGKHYKLVQVDSVHGADTIRSTLTDVIVSGFHTNDRSGGEPAEIDVVSFQSEQELQVEIIPTPTGIPSAAPSAKPGAPARSGAAPGNSSGLKQAVLHVRVVDEKSTERTPKSKDRVTVDGVPLKYDAANGFVHPLNGKGDLRLKIEYDGFETLEQTFHFDAPALRPTLLPYWPGKKSDPEAKGETREGYLLACMSLGRTAGGFDNQRSPKVFNLTVTLHPTKTYVAVLGTDYWEDPLGSKPKRKSLDFREYALTYARHLSATGMLNLSSPLIVMDCQRGRIERWDRATGRGWQRHYTIEKLEPAPAWTKSSDFVAWRAPLNGASATKYLGATRIYKYLSDVGTRMPQTVANFSVFSHAYQGGPILFNTIVDDARRGRTEYDLDMRFWLDFNSPSVNDWPNMPKAFDTNGSIHIWGCFNTEIIEQMARFLTNNSNGKAARFVSAEDNINLDRAGVVKYLRETIAKHSFMSSIARFTGKRAFGSVPGFGADNLNYDNIPTIPQKLKTEIDGQLAHVRAITMVQQFRRLFESAEMGAQRFDEFGYMLYKPQ